MSKRGLSLHTFLSLWKIDNYFIIISIVYWRKISIKHRKCTTMQRGFHNETATTADIKHATTYHKHPCRSGGTVSFVLPFTTNIKISTSISQLSIPRSIFHVGPPMVVLSHSSYDIPGLVSLIHVLFWGRRDFHKL